MGHGAEKWNLQMDLWWTSTKDMRGEEFDQVESENGKKGVESNEDTKIQREETEEGEVGRKWEEQWWVSGRNTALRRSLWKSCEETRRQESNDSHEVG